MKRIYLSLYIFGISTCLLPASTVANNAIFNGYLATRYEFPYHVSVYAGNQQTPNCGGGIIGNLFILTAAHCVLDRYGNLLGAPINVLAATYDLVSPGIIINVEIVITPIDYRASNKDITVLKLRRPLRLTDNHILMQLRIPRNHRQNYANKTALIAGFGWNWFELRDNRHLGGRNDTRLRFVNAVVLNNTDCEREHRNMNVTRAHLCARVKQPDHGNPRGVCFGDGGGPLVYDRKVIGILSVANVDCLAGTGSAVFTRVSSYITFIDHAIDNYYTSRMNVIPL